MSSPRIALIHATAVAMAPVCEAFQSGWPQARITHLLDDSLSTDLAAEGSLGHRMIERFVTLARYSAGCGADAILFTCSAFGAAIEAARAAVDIPVLKPNEAMFDEALETGRRIGLISTFEPSIPSMVRELEDEAKRRAIELDVRSRSVPDALAALRRGDSNLHDELIARAGADFKECDVLMLAQFSMARAASRFEPFPGRRVLTSPGSAVSRLKRDLAQFAVA
ncbi:MAG: aspartate/glutamate racemase family protein [Burkholderiales bacterium]